MPLREVDKKLIEAKEKAEKAMRAVEAAQAKIRAAETEKGGIEKIWKAKDKLMAQIKEKRAPIGGKKTRKSKKSKKGTRRR